METIPASLFKEKCLYILDHLDPDGIVISKHGKPVARLLPLKKASAENIGRLKGRIKIKGNIFTTGIKWDAES